MFRFAGVDLPNDSERTALFDMLASVSIDGAPAGDLADYLAADFDRFLYTLALVPEGGGRALEVGANPYFMSVLLRTLRPGYQLEQTNYFEGWGDTITQAVRWNQDGSEREEVLASANVNLEAEAVPQDGERYALILFCEVLEHFTANPVKALAELWRLLEPDGVLILTTPNVARFENIAALLDGRNLYDPYSGHGPHGRHNREYTRHELHMLMRHCGFVPDFDFTSDVHAHSGSYLASADVMALTDKIPHRDKDLGQYLFSRWRKAGTPARGLPGWLYRSYPAELLADYAAS